MTRIAFLGLGNMGAPMAANLVKAGHTVVGFDPVPAALDHARDSGLIVAADAVAAVADVEIVITMFPSGKHVIDAYREGLLAAATPGTLFIDSSTIDVDDARTARSLAVAAGHRGMDAPVSGGVGGATAGTLTFMVGADEADFAAAEPILSVMGGRIVHCGETGAGQCWALTTNCPVPGPVPASPANRDYQPGFSGALMAKDLGLALGALTATGTAAELGPLAASIYRRFADEGGAGLDFSAIINTIRNNSEGAAV